MASIYGQSDYQRGTNDGAVYGVGLSRMVGSSDYERGYQDGLRQGASLCLSQEPTILDYQRGLAVMRVNI